MILIALGANLKGPYGPPENTLKMALVTLENAGVHIVGKSRIWVTEPVPVSDQPLYRNAVIAVQTKRSPIDLLELLHTIEADFGRVRSERNAARILDLDLLSYNDVVIHDECISIPHPRMHERAFVLVPLCEVNSDWVHPVLQKTANELLSMLPDRASLDSMTAAA
ncbi:MAG: 2-amino-4-hydroxy-6-hydroxymethyldihydropteridine diphosphokinase [Micavibrio sp.]|nr:2-amino-4-hydroxy-6-hydroxymethyldihydropteridine diphosphokinase [Micavibrio sp.]